MPLAAKRDAGARPDLTGWAFRAVITVIFLSAGYDKFDGTPGSGWVKIYQMIGWGQWFRIATGVIEIVGGLLYLFPRTCYAGAALLSATMLGAIVAHLTVLHDPIAIIIPGALLAAIVIIAARDPSLDEMVRLRD